MEALNSNSCSLAKVFHQMVTFKVKQGNKEWLCSAVYASPKLSSKEHLWHYMMRFRCGVCLPWFLVGDFNQVLLRFEVKGCSFSTSLT